ncbi:MAG: phage holin family protein [Acidimicrobiia bacterium]|nr:phage holin family protein [Acidimicrobiia bacterium]
MANPNPLDGAQEIQELLVSYAKQETVEPLKQLGRYLGYGLAGSLLVFMGAFFVGLGVLRLTQTVDTFSGSSWASTLPYVITIAVLVLFVALIMLTLTRAKKKIR